MMAKKEKVSLVLNPSLLSLMLCMYMHQKKPSHYFSPAVFARLLPAPAPKLPLALLGLPATSSRAPSFPNLLAIAVFSLCKSPSCSCKIPTSLLKSSASPLNRSLSLLTLLTTSLSSLLTLFSAAFRSSRSFFDSSFSISRRYFSSDFLTSRSWRSLAFSCSPDSD